MVVKFLTLPQLFGIMDQMYVHQLEKRVAEQEQLISLLNEKIVWLESNAGGNLASSSGAPFNPDVTDVEKLNLCEKQIPHFTGSRVTNISSVRYIQFFVSRIHPSTTAALLAQNLQTAVPELSIKCSKMLTRYDSYASFHVVVPEDQGHLLSNESIWPQGSFVKLFEGKLLKSHIIETFNNQISQAEVEEAEEIPKDSDSSQVVLDRIAARVAENVKNSQSKISSSSIQKTAGTSTMKSKTRATNRRASSKSTESQAASSRSNPKNLRGRQAISQNH